MATAATAGPDADGDSAADPELKFVRSWNCSSVAGLLAQDSDDLLDLLDPLQAWGRPVTSEALEASCVPARAPAAAGTALPAWVGGTLIRILRLSALLDGEQVGFCECAVLRRVRPLEHRACRICFEECAELLDGCACRGTMRFICRECLVLQWATRAKSTTSDAAAALKCGLCHQDFSGKALSVLTTQIHSVVQKHKEDFPVPSPAEEEERYKMQITTATQLWKQGSHSEAAALFRKTIPGLELLKGPKDPLVLSAQHNLSLLLTAQGRLEEASTYVSAARDGFTRLYGPKHVLALKAAHNEAMVAQLMGRLAEAYAGYKAVLDMRREVLGPDNLDTVKTSCNLGLVMLHSGAMAEAEALLRSTLRDMERLVGRSHPLALVALQNLSLVLAECEPVPLEAEELAREAVEGKRRALGSEHPDTLEGHRDLATVLIKSGREDEAEEALRQALAGMQKLLGFTHPTTERVVRLLAELLERRGQASAALRLTEEHGRGSPMSGAKEPPVLLPEGSLNFTVLCLYVAPAYRKRGIGRAMIRHCKALAHDLHADAMEAHVPVGVPRAAAFFAHCGFERKGTEKQQEVTTGAADVATATEGAPRHLCLRLQV